MENNNTSKEENNFTFTIRNTGLGYYSIWCNDIVVSKIETKEDKEDKNDKQ